MFRAKIVRDNVDNMGNGLYIKRFVADTPDGTVEVIANVIYVDGEVANLDTTITNQQILRKIPKLEMELQDLIDDLYA